MNVLRYFSKKHCIRIYIWMSPHCKCLMFIINSKMKHLYSLCYGETTRLHTLNTKFWFWNRESKIKEWRKMNYKEKNQIEKERCVESRRLIILGNEMYTTQFHADFFNSMVEHFNEPLRSTLNNLAHYSSKKLLLLQEKV